MKVTSYLPTYELEWKPNQPDGTGSARIAEEEGVVELFTRVAGVNCPGFTYLRIWIHPRMYHTTLPRHYHPSWWRRLTRRFAWEAGKLADGGAS